MMLLHLAVPRNKRYQGMSSNSGPVQSCTTNYIGSTHAEVVALNHGVIVASLKDISHPLEYGLLVAASRGPPQLQPSLVLHQEVATSQKIQKRAAWQCQHDLFNCLTLPSHDEPRSQHNFCLPSPQMKPPAPRIF